MKRTIQTHSDKWFGAFADAGVCLPTIPQVIIPAPTPEFGTEPPVNADFGRTIAFA